MKEARKPSEVVKTTKLPSPLAKKMKKFLELADQLEILENEIKLLGAKEEVLEYVSKELDDNGTIIAKIGDKVAKLEYYAESERVDWKKVASALAAKIDPAIAIQEQLIKEMSEANKKTVKEFVKIKQMKTSGIIKDTLGKAWNAIKGLWQGVKKTLSKTKTTNQNLLEALDEQLDKIEKNHGVTNTSTFEQEVYSELFN